MTMTDPIADMLTRLRNANQAYHDQVKMPYSKIKANIAEVLKAEGYISTWSVEEPEEGAVGKRLVVELKYGQSRERSLAGIKRVSKPVSGCTPSRTGSRGCSVGWVWRSFRRPRGC